MRQSGNFLVKIIRMNPDGSRDYVDMHECIKIDSAKRVAANYTREAGLIATVYDVFNHGEAIYQYRNGRRVAEVA
jgi:hypothetical protein